MNYKCIFNKVLAFSISLLIAVSFSSCKKESVSKASSSSFSSSSVPSSTSKSASSSSKVSESKAVTSSSDSKTSSRKATASKVSTTQSTAKTSSTKKSNSSLSCSITVDATKGGKGKILSSKKVEITKGQSVFDALKKSGVSISSKGAGSSVYVVGINGLSEFDKGSQSGWIFLVNGKMGSQSAGAIKLSGGENIKWVYTIDMGRTEAKAG